MLEAFNIFCFARVEGPYFVSRADCNGMTTGMKVMAVVVRGRPLNINVAGHVFIVYVCAHVMPLLHGDAEEL